MRTPVRWFAVPLLTVSAAWPAFADPYRIEVVVFEQYADTPELLVAETPEETPERSYVGELPPARPAPGEQTLGPIAYTLERRGYPVLLHTAWVEDVGGRASQNWHRVDMPRLEGGLRVRLGRFLHFDTDLQIPSASAEPVRARNSRRMRSTEVHYLDHPRIGVIVRIDPYTPPGPATGGSSSEPSPPAASTNP